MKRDPKKTARNKADKLFQQLGMMKHKHCEICGQPAQCMHHFVTKGASGALRYEEENGVPVCGGCHLKFHSKHSALMNARVTLMRGEEWINRLEEKKRAEIRTNLGYYKSIIEHLEGEILNQEINH